MVRKAIEIVNAARQVSRPAASEFISEIFEDFIELHGDRYFADDQSVVGGIASLRESCHCYWHRKRSHN